MSTPAPTPVPGARWTPSGAEFTVYCPDAARMWLMLFDSSWALRPVREYELNSSEHRRDGYWTVSVDRVVSGTWYAWRADGSHPPFDPDQWILDPAAELVDWNRAWGDSRGLTPEVWPKHGAGFPKGLLVRDAFEWGDDAPPRIPWTDTVIYEAHLRGFTAHPSSGVAAPGTYAGFIEKIPYLRELGVTAVELLPIHEFNELEFFHENGARRSLVNFWGYSPVAWRAPMSRYASTGAAGARIEFKQLVRELHRAGIEVILDVVFNHTGELPERGSVYHFKALDSSGYYLTGAHGVKLPDFTGCGNTVNANREPVTSLILDALRHWLREYHVDGFRFDLASALTRGPDGQPQKHPALFALMDADPELSKVKRIAEAWDAVGLYQVGSFPSPAMPEWNGMYRDDLRKFWNGHHGRLGLFATRLSGSSDLYGGQPAGPLKSINFVTAHDGFTLADLVSYTHRRNEANGEANRDGENHNFSANSGVEGPTQDPAILARRMRIQRCMLATLAVSQGVPMLLGGDEFGRTQQGNNNAYAQDNEISWVDWSQLDAHRDLHDFVRTVLRFRQSHPALRRTTFFNGAGQPNGERDATWLGPDDQDPDWNAGHAIALWIRGSRVHTGAAADDDDLWLVFNAGTHPALFRIPPSPSAWSMAWSTEEGLRLPDEPSSSTFSAPAHSVTAFTALRG
ncbi:MAG: glycogen debranching enzyme [Kiritimatiellae bacterium]|nr:glycogen debranching enzyme [Kiritimatiellia bacterium]